LLVAVVQDPAEAFPDPALPDAGHYPALVCFHNRMQDLYLEDAVTTLLFDSWKPAD